MSEKTKATRISKNENFVSLEGKAGEQMNSSKYLLERKLYGRNQAKDYMRKRAFEK